MGDFKFEFNPEDAQDPEKATDMEIALLLIGHMDRPCEVETGHGEKENIRERYIREAEKEIEKMTNPFAIKMLKEKIGEYKDK